MALAEQVRQLYHSQLSQKAKVINLAFSSLLCSASCLSYIANLLQSLIIILLNQGK